MTDPAVFLRPIIEEAERRMTVCSSVVIAIDGMAAAGKTTAADWLARRWNAPVVHMDDFFLPASLRTAVRLAEPGGNVHYERFAGEVLPALSAGTAFSYRAFDCSVMAPGRVVSVPSAPIILVEGAYAMHPYFGEYAGLKIFFSIDPKEQQRRILARNGPGKLPDFRDRWIPMENTYHAAFSIRARADIVIGGSDASEGDSTAAKAPC